jgi:hypothetical protein
MFSINKLAEQVNASGASAAEHKDLFAGHDSSENPETLSLTWR